MLGLLPLVLVPTLPPAAVPPTAGDAWKAGAPELRSVGALAFGPPGVLFVADPEAAAVIALDTGDTEEPAGPRDLDVEGLADILGYLLGASPEQVAVADLAVNPVSGRAYLSVTRGEGAAARPALVRVSGPEQVEVLDLTKLRHMRATFENVPEAGGTGRRNQRAMSITDIEFLDGDLYVAGLSNEEFASKLRQLPFPFDGTATDTSVEIYHASHGAWETRSPVRTFMPMNIAGEPHLLAGYTCTPLVKFPVKELLPGVKLKGTTVAELGNRNTPLDMVAYEKGGEPFVLIANTSRGVMKLGAKGLTAAAALTEPVREPSGLHYETVDALAGVTQLAALDATRALALVEADGARSLKIIELP